MVEKFDVPSRLAEGWPAVENLQRYVWACHLLGYQHPDLTVHAAQLRDWYGSEDGMDLGALHGDCLGLEAAVRSTQDALGVQDRQLSTLSAVWQGAGADASRDFLRRHSEASAAAATAVRTAAEALGALRDDLWRAVDAKVGAVVAVEDRTRAHRADWLSAAETVTTGAGDRTAAAELVDQAVKPFVDNSISTDWLTAMHTAMSSVVDAYQRAAGEIADEHAPVFDVPGDLGPTWSPPPARVSEATGCEAGCEDRGSAPAPATVLANAPSPAATMPSAWAPPAPPAAPLPAPPTPAAPTALPEQVPSMPPLGTMSSGIPDVGSGLSGLGQQFADTLGGLLGGADGAVPELDDPLEVPELDDPLADTEDGANDAEEVDEAVDEEVLEDPPVEDPVAAGEPVEPESEPCDGTAEVSVEPAPAPTPAPPPAEALPPAEPLTDPVADEQTPCAIAADELPQVGDPPE